MKTLQRVAIVVAALAICISLMTVGASYSQFRVGIGFIYTGLLILILLSGFSDVTAAIKNNGELNVAVIMVGCTASLIWLVCWLLGFVGIYIGVQ